MPKSSEIEGLIARLEAATGPDREIDAALVALFNDAMVKRYPPTDDFGPKNQWQFWSLDGAHFLGNEGSPRLKVEPYTASIDAALALVERVLPGYIVALTYSRDFNNTILHEEDGGEGTAKQFLGLHRTAPLAILFALLRALARSAP